MLREMLLPPLKTQLKSLILLKVLSRINLLLMYSRQIRIVRIHLLTQQSFQQ